MAKLTFGMSWNYDAKEYHSFLNNNKLVHLKNHNEEYFKVGDGLKTKEGVTARIVEKYNNHENLSHDFTIANNKLTKEELDSHFSTL
jgi:hypothetical protein